MDTSVDSRKKKAAAPPDREALERAIERARDHLLGLQSGEGYWVGELEADASVTGGYIPLTYFMTGGVDPVRQRKAVEFMKSKQREDGSWGSYYEGPGDLSVSIQCYFALKLAGISPDESFMRRARDFIRSRGGVMKSNTITRVWLSVFGQFDYRGTPSVPPELMFFPGRFFFNIYEFASWSRATIVALMVVLTNRPVCRVPDYARIDELYVEPAGERNYTTGKLDWKINWRNFFLLTDRAFKAWDRLPYRPLRRRALRRAERWIIDHQEADGSWGGIMLPWVYSLYALKSQGHGLDHPAVARGMKGLEGFIVEDGATMRLQPATSPVWDTSWATIALAESGLPPDHNALVKSARWLLKEEIRSGGDWQVKNRRTAPGCWAFEFENDLYPDIDDTAVVPRALRKVALGPSEEESKNEAIGRGLRWVSNMQSRNGGWAAFDRDNDMEMLSHVPFADFISPLDPTCADVTAHTIELLAEERAPSSALKRAIEYLKGCQEPDGAWYGRWGVNYLYGTGLVLAALGATGENMKQDYIRRAVGWLESRQNRDGGWGETCRTYEDPSCRGDGPSTASQTGWALMGFVAAGESAGEPARKAAAYLMNSQREDGSWREDAYTGTGFPRAFYLRYDLYRIYFPLLALARYKTALEVAAHE